MPLLKTIVRTSRIADGVYAVTIEGDLDLDVAPTVRTRLGDLVEGGATTIVVDLLEVRFIDSAGLSALIAVRNALKATRGELVLVAESPPLKLLAIAGLGRAFRIEKSLSEAVSYAVDGRK